MNVAIVARPTAIQKLGATLSAKVATPNSRICLIMVAKVQRESGRCAIQRNAAIVPAPTAPASHENSFAPYPENIIGEAREEYENRSVKHGQQNDQMSGPTTGCNVVNLTPIENSCRELLHSIRLRNLSTIRRKSKTMIIKP
mgnify:CR=1 FL=1